MNRKLLIFAFLLSCQHFQPADPVLSERILLNETDMGFISREFFQIKVEIPITSYEVSGEKKRSECKAKAMVERERLSLPYLLEVNREKYNFGDGFFAYENSKEGKERRQRITNDSKTAVQPSVSAQGPDPMSLNNQNPTITSTSSNPLQSNSNLLQNPIDVRGNPQKEKESMEYSQTFAWFFESLFLYKEDYSNRGKCTFLFRNIQQKLYERVESSPILIKKRTQVYPNESIPQKLPTP